MASKRYIVNEPSFIDGTLRQAGDVVTTDLGSDYDAKLHANLTPFTPKALEKMKAELDEAEREVEQNPPGQAGESQPTPSAE